MIGLKIRMELFWDLDKDRLSEETHRRIIIERVLNLGNLSEFREIVKFYGLEIIRKEISQAGDLDPKTVAFIESFLKVNKQELRCYSKQR
jgi:hypothetical protein